MTSLIAVLEQFTSQKVSRDILYAVLSELFQLAEHGQDIPRSHYDQRLNAWRSNACLRGLSNSAGEYRSELVSQGKVVPGHFPSQEMPDVKDFLVWFLAKRESRFITTSSDVAGIAACLQRLGLDLIHIQWSADDVPSTDDICTLVYSESPVMQQPSSTKQQHIQLGRLASTTVPIMNPCEAISSFPLAPIHVNKCRIAWKLGEAAADVVQVRIESLDWAILSILSQQPSSEIRYLVINTGREVERSSPEIFLLAEKYGLSMNSQLIHGLTECLGTQPADTLSWIHNTIQGTPFCPFTKLIGSAHFSDQDKIAAFSIFQSFFMGYYYAVFGRLVDTSTLASQTVEGAWRFRSASLMKDMAEILQKQAPSLQESSHTMVFLRSTIFNILDMLFLEGQAATIEDKYERLDKSCLGIIGKRSLFVNTALGKCSCPQEISGFTLLDVDVGGIPRNHWGLVKAGVITDRDRPKYAKDEPLRTYENLMERSPEHDATFNIEPDWEGNPNTALLCVRYTGRRIFALSPTTYDWQFCVAHVDPKQPSDDESPEGSKFSRPALAHGVPLEIGALLKSDLKLPVPKPGGPPMLIQVLDRPRLRYTAAAMYADARFLVTVATDSVQRAIEYSGPNKNLAVGNTSRVVIAGLSSRK